MSAGVVCIAPLLMKRPGLAGTNDEQAGLFMSPWNSRKAVSEYTAFFCFFALDTKKPYLKHLKEVHDLDMGDLPIGTGFGFRTYMQDLAKLYEADFKGPFTLGVCWALPEAETGNGKSGSESDEDDDSESESD